MVAGRIGIRQRFSLSFEAKRLKGVGPESGGTLEGFREALFEAEDFEASSPVGGAAIAGSAGAGIRA